MVLGRFLDFLESIVHTAGPSQPSTFPETEELLIERPERPFPTTKVFASHLHMPDQAGSPKQARPVPQLVMAPRAVGDNLHTSAPETSPCYTQTRFLEILLCRCSWVHMNVKNGAFHQVLKEL